MSVTVFVFSTRIHLSPRSSCLLGTDRTDAFNVLTAVPCTVPAFIHSSPFSCHVGERVDVVTVLHIIIIIHHHQSFWRTHSSLQLKCRHIQQDSLNDFFLSFFSFLFALATRVQLVRTDTWLMRDDRHILGSGEIALHCIASEAGVCVYLYYMYSTASVESNSRYHKCA